MELVKEVTQGARVLSEKGESWKSGRGEEEKQDMALKEKEKPSSFCVGASYLALMPQSKAKLLPAHHITLTLFFPQEWGSTACSCQGGLL